MSDALEGMFAAAIVVGCVFGVGFCAKSVLGGNVEGLQATIVEIGLTADRYGCAPVKLKYEGGSCIGPKYVPSQYDEATILVCYPMIGQKVCDTRNAH